MPVVQLQDDTGSNIGSALGAVAGYFATQKQRKADKQAASDRQTASDARTNQAAADLHAKTVSDIADRDAGTKRTAANDQTTQLSQGSYQKYFPMLSNPPTADGKPLKGPALANALQKIKIQAMNEGMTAPANVKDFDVEVARIMQADQAQGAQQFLGGEHALPSDPMQRLSTLMKRLQIERAQPGVDTKPTETMIADTQKQITEAQAAAHQNATEARQSHHDSVMEGQGAQRLGIEATRAARTGTGGESWSTAGNALYSQAMGLPTQQALALVDKPNSSITPKERAAIRTAIKDAKAPVVKTPEDPDNESNANRIMQSGAVLKLPQSDQADLNTNLRRYGYSVVSKHLQDIVSGKVKDPSTPPERAQRVLQAIQ